MSDERPIILTEHTRFGGETGAGLMRNRCAFTSKDMSTEFADAFAYAIVLGWDRDEPDDDDPHGAMREQAAKWGWDDELVSFLRDAHERFQQLPDRIEAGDE